MFTQCSKCETVFRLTVETLRAAGGQVRCGRCGEVFNALSRLADTPGGFVRGESSLDLESRADAILEFPPSLNLDDQPPMRHAAGPRSSLLAVDEDAAAGDVPSEPPPSESDLLPGIEIARLQIVEPLDGEAGGLFADELDISREAADVDALDIGREDEAAAARVTTPTADASDAGASPPSSDDDADDLASSMEFTLPPAELDRIFVESQPGALLRIAAEPPYFVDSRIERAHESAAPFDAAAPPDPAVRVDPAGVEQSPHPESATLTVLAPQPVPPFRTPGVAGSGTDAPRANPPRATLPIGDGRYDPATGTAAPSAAPSVGHHRPIAGLDVSEHAREALAGGDDEPIPAFIGEAHRRRVPKPLWIAGAVLLLLLLTVQLLAANRTWLAAHAPAGSIRRGLLGAVGISIPPSIDLAAYQLRQWGASGDPSALGSLKVRATVLNTAAQMHPFPLLRVTFVNRFGTHMGSRDFAAADYAGKPVGPMMKPGEQVDALMTLQDPGKDAEGFEIDVCLRASASRVDCAGDSSAAKK